MQRSEVSGAVRPIYVSLGVKRLIQGACFIVSPSKGILLYGKPTCARNLEGCEINNNNNNNNNNYYYYYYYYY